MWSMYSSATGSDESPGPDGVVEHLAHIPGAHRAATARAVEGDMFIRPDGDVEGRPAADSVAVTLVAPCRRREDRAEQLLAIRVGVLGLESWDRGLRHECAHQWCHVGGSGCTVCDVQQPSRV